MQNDEWCSSLQKSSDRYITILLSLRNGDASYFGRSGETFLFFALNPIRERIIRAISPWVDGLFKTTDGHSEPST